MRNGQLPVCDQTDSINTINSTISLSQLSVILLVVARCRSIIYKGFLSGNRGGGRRWLI